MKRTYRCCVQSAARTLSSSSSSAAASVVQRPATIVVTLLSPSPWASRRMLEFLRSSCSASDGSGSGRENSSTGGSSISSRILANDALNQLMTKSTAWSQTLLDRLRVPLAQFQPAATTFDSVILSMGDEMSQTSSIIHWLSIDHGTSTDSVPTKGAVDNGVELLSIQSIGASSKRVNHDSDNDFLLQDIRDRLALLLQHTQQQQQSVQESSSSSTSFAVGAVDFIQRHYRTWTNRQTTRDYLPPHMQHHPRCLPLIDVGTSHDAVEPERTGLRVDAPHSWRAGDLKEIVLPVYDSDVYPDTQQSLFTTLYTLPHGTRPVPGVYRFGHSNIGLRPIPMAPHDRSAAASAPTLVFHVDDIQTSWLKLQTASSTTRVGKIGHTGSDKFQNGASGSSVSSGQLVVADTAMSGVDVRLCAATKPCSQFAEAQESLLAGSLSELQSRDVLATMETKQDDDERQRRKNTASTTSKDCWVEFRANLRHPLGFFPLRGSRPLGVVSTATPGRIAKPPNLPFE